MPNWVTVMRVDELPADRPVTVRVNERDIALARCEHDGLPHALDNRCAHRGGQLGDGTIEGDDIICPLHGYDYDLHTGISRYAPMERVAVYPVRVHTTRSRSTRRQCPRCRTITTRATWTAGRAGTTNRSPTTATCRACSTARR